MRTIQRIPRSWAAGFLLILAAGCGKVFDVTPYDAEPQVAPQGSSATQAVAIRASLEGHSGPLTFALTSDPHFYYSDLGDVVAHIDRDPSIAFTLVPGDLTDQGLLGEFEAFARIMGGSSRPWLALIGNHDHLGNGRTIFETLFGPRNSVLDVAGYRFILFDDTVWESGMAPDLAWLQAALAGSGELIPVVVTHIPPFTDQMVGVYEQQFRQVVADAGSPLVIYGHLHNYNDHMPYGDGVRYHCVPWPRDRSYSKVTLQGREVSIERIRL